MLFLPRRNEAKHDHELELEVACVAGGIVWVRD